MKGNKCCDVIWGIEVLRCLHCGKLLAKINTKGILACEIKCPRCGKINEV